MKIHPTAIIHSRANLHASVEVGAYSVVDADATIGEGCVIDTGVHIYSGVHAGKNNKFGHNCAIGGLPQDMHFDAQRKTGVSIGDNNTFREYFTVHRSTREDTPTRIGSDNYYMGNCHVAHDCVVGDENVFVQVAGLAGHVHVGNRTLISANSCIHQFCRVGDYALVAGLAKVVKDVPPYGTIDGNPATVIGINSIGMKRQGLTSDQRNAIKQAYKVIYHSKLNTTQALAELKATAMSPEVKSIVEFFEASDRGVTAHRDI
ncbi:MAG: acyl-ACP--UDP-N-acetylglucosamine O-acyltransferase [Spirochaetia bacterium]|nr:acyl-ACP--UDP-N-acetylglucosamine O-acyltransferase [Spirochaetia bacterium]